MKRDVKQIIVSLPFEFEYSRFLLEGAIRYSQEHSDLQLLDRPYHPGHKPKWLTSELDCDGILLWASKTENWVKSLLRTKLPMVNVCSGWPVERMPVVALSAASQVRAAVDHLGKTGRPMVGFVCWDLKYETPFQRRSELFMQIASERNLNHCVLDIGHQPEMDSIPPRLTKIGQSRLQVFLKQLPKGTGLWAKSDKLGALVLQEAAKLGLKVPEDLAVLGLGDLQIARECRPALSSIPQPGEAVGYQALQVLHRLTNGQPLPSRIVTVESPSVVERGSTVTNLVGDEAITKAHAYLVEHACKGVTADELLRLVPLSQPTFYKRFIARYGRTPGAEIRRVVLEQATYYLRTTSLSVTRIGELCGYDHPSRFSTFFKTETGQTPTAFRLKLRL